MPPRTKSSAPSKRASIAFGKYRETPDTIWRPPVTIFEPHYETTGDILDALRTIERADHELARLPPTPGSALHRVRREMLARNAFATASIEGNPLTLPEVQDLLGHERPRARGPDEIEIFNFADLMSRADPPQAPRAPADILRIHKLLFHRVMDDPGRWKTRLNFIGRVSDHTVVYVPTAPERVGKELQLALHWLHSADHVHPIIRALLFHHEFESIHPFLDGNGRTGRALTPMILHEHGYRGAFLVPFDHRIHKTRDQYYATLAEVERGGFKDHTPWLEYAIHELMRSYEEAVESALFHRALPETLTERQRAVAAWFARFHADTPGARVKFADVQTVFAEIPERTLKRDLAALRDAKVLEARGRLKGTTYGLRAADQSE